MGRDRGEVLERLDRFLAPLGVSGAQRGGQDALKQSGFAVGRASEDAKVAAADPVARELGVGFVPARKPGKLPHDTVSAEYALEYGIDALEVHADALAGGARVLIHDDLLATGGTASALCELTRGLGAEIVGCAFLIELSFLGGRARLEPYRVEALIDYPSG